MTRARAFVTEGGRVTLELHAVTIYTHQQLRRESNMHRGYIFGIVALALAIVVIGNAGPLVPPPGPVAPTYQTLDEVETRTVLVPIAGQTIVIDTPGSYLLGGDLEVTEIGVDIRVTGVTLDLNGFTIRGNAFNDPGIDVGVYAGLNVGGVNDEPIVVRNGTIANFVGGGVEIADERVSVIVEDVFAERGDRGGIIVSGDATVRRSVVEGGPTGFTGGAGIDVGGRAIIESCVVRDIVGDGISVSAGIISDCTVEGAAGNAYSVNSGAPLDDAVLIERCSAVRSGNDGFLVNAEATLRACVARDNNSRGFRLNASATVEGCVSDRNFVGFEASDRASFRGCIARSNVNNGFSLGPRVTLVDCTADNNGLSGFLIGQYSTVRGCVATQNGRHGVETDQGVAINDSVASFNQLDGFNLGFDNRISGCVADTNGNSNSGNNAGIRGNSDCVIDGNTCTDNPIGIVGGPGALVVRNSCAGNNTDYDLSGSNAGPVSSNAVSEPSPWANFSF
ncbi:MAG: hypothetical protein Tsb0013_08550 [Phycisphaerales bacterium]